MLWTHLTLDREDTCSAIHAGSDTRISACCTCSWEEMAGACMGGVRCEEDAGLLRIRTLTRFTRTCTPHVQLREMNSYEVLASTHNGREEPRNIRHHAHFHDWPAIAIVDVVINLSFYFTLIWFLQHFLCGFCVCEVESLACSSCSGRYCTGGQPSMRLWSRLSAYSPASLRIWGQD